MSYNPDPIFRDGLNGYRKSAPPSAWERIESGLDKKRQKGMWLKIAAGLLLLIASSIVFWQYGQTDSVLAANSKELPTSILKPDTIVSVVKEQSESMPRQSSVVNREIPMDSQKPAIEENKSSIVNRQSSIKVRDKANTQVEIESVSINEPDVKKTVSVVEVDIENTNELPEKIEVIEPNRTNLTYTADQVNAKFTKTNVEPEATPEKKNASGLKIVIDKALEFTNEGTVFGEIREKKNEWLSFNHLSNKTEPNK